MQADTPSTARLSYWRKCRRLTGWLLALWFLSTFCIIFFARELSHITLFGWPLPFYMASQGLIVLYALIIGIYARRMQRLDRMLARDEGNGD